MTIPVGDSGCVDQADEPMEVGGAVSQASEEISGEVLSVLAPHPPSIAHVRNDTENSPKYSSSSAYLLVKTLVYSYE